MWMRVVALPSHARLWDNPSASEIEASPYGPCTVLLLKTYVDSGLMGQLIQGLAPVE